MAPFDYKCVVIGSGFWTKQYYLYTASPQSTVPFLFVWQFVLFLKYYLYYFSACNNNCYLIKSDFLNPKTSLKLLQWMIHSGASLQTLLSVSTMIASFAFSSQRLLPTLPQPPKVTPSRCSPVLPPSLISLLHFRQLFSGFGSHLSPKFWITFQDLHKPSSIDSARHGALCWVTQMTSKGPAPKDLAIRWGEKHENTIM